MSSEFLKLDNQLCFLLYSSSRAMTSIYRPLLTALDLTYPQYLVMLVLWERHDTQQAASTVTELGQRLFLDSGTLTPMLKRLEKQGLIHRQRRAEDERVVEIHLTSAGVALQQQAEEIPNRLLCLAGLDVARFAMLRDELRELLPQLQNVEGQLQDKTG